MFVFVASVVRLSVCHRLESVRVALVDGQLLLVGAQECTCAIHDASCCVCMLLWRCALISVNSITQLLLEM